MHSYCKNVNTIVDNTLSEVCIQWCNSNNISADSASVLMWILILGASCTAII
jgi:hypothetical protein